MLAIFDLRANLCVAQRDKHSGIENKNEARDRLMRDKGRCGDRAGRDKVAQITW